RNRLPRPQLRLPRRSLCPILASASDFDREVKKRHEGELVSFLFGTTPALFAVLLWLPFCFFPRGHATQGELSSMKSSAGRDTEKQSMRQFTWMAALVLAIVARYAEPNDRISLTVAAAVVFSVGTVLPKVFVWPYRFFLIGFYPVIRLTTIIFAT